MSGKFVLHHSCVFLALQSGAVLLKRPICISEMLLVPRKYNGFNNVPLGHFLIDFNAHKNDRCLATCTNSTSDHGRLWILEMFNNCRGAWSVHIPDSIVLGIISEKESLLALICGPFQKFSLPLELYEFVFFSEKLNFSQLVRFQSKLRFCYSPHPSVAYSHLTSDMSHGNPRISLDSLFDGLTIP
ncbi:uncharacterized protein TNCV_3509091 [Trichonephila clavipes]|nr:uncharacterized protein TNCV_3509091 [Trichonephila clavipes]